MATEETVGSGSTLATRTRLTEALSLAIAAVGLGLLVWGAAVTMPPLAVVGALITAAAGSVLMLARRIRASVEPSLRSLEQTLVAVDRGDLRARATVSDGAEPAVRTAIAALNRLVAGVASDRGRLRDVAARAFRAQEAERQRIARELQEETAQTLSTALFVLRAARQTDDHELRDSMLDELRDNLTRTTDSIRAYARVLHPPALKELGLVAALESYARSLAASGVTVEILADDITGVLPIEGELALYRIVQEALGNVVRHARATGVLVRVRNAGDSVRTLVEDDGHGFALEEAEARLPCLGLFGMRERALSVGGTVEIDSIPGDGTSVRISIPSATRAATSRAWPVIMRPADPEPLPSVEPGWNPGDGPA
jgi:two-component system, NarL family, sensor histidine kinase UhpB